MVFALLYGTCASGSSHEGSDKATCQASGDCRSTGNSALLQQRTARNKISVEPKEEFVEELPSDDPEYDRQLAAIQKGLPADLQGADLQGGVELIYDSNEVGDCSVCPADQYIFRDNKLAGRLERDQPPITCKAADDYMKFTARFMPCNPAPTQWINRCCRLSPTPAPTPAPTPRPRPPPRSLPRKRKCNLCANMKDMAWHFYAAKDKKGFYNCSRAQRYIESPTAKASCAKGRRWWRKTCCQDDKKIHCHMCRNGLKDIKRHAVAGDYFGKIYTCWQLHKYMHSKALKKPYCNTVKERSRKRCCFSSR